MADKSDKPESTAGAAPYGEDDDIRAELAAADADYAAGNTISGEELRRAVRITARGGNVDTKSASYRGVDAPQVRHRTWPDGPGVGYYRCACCVELQEVSPRPGRTTVALGLRDFWGGQTSRVPMMVGLMSLRQSPPFAQHQAIASGMASSASVCERLCS